MRATPSHYRNYTPPRVARGPPPLATDVANQLVRTVLSPSSLNTVTIRSCAYSLETISDSITHLTLSLETQPATKLRHILRGNTSLKELRLLVPLDKDEVYDIIDSLKDNHSLERLWLLETSHSQYFSESERQALDPRVVLCHSILAI